MHDIIRFIKLLESSVVLLDGVSETVKHEIKIPTGRISWYVLETLGPSMLENILTGKLVVRAGKEIMAAGEKCNNMNHMDKIF